MIRVYLSGPITGLSEEEYTRRFATAERHCEAAGYEVVNPVTIGQELQKTNQFNYCGYCGAPLNKQPLCPKCGRTNK